MTIRTKNIIVDDNMREEIQLAESRKIAKDMACRRACGEPDPQFPLTEHVITCPYWEPKGGEK